MTSKTPRGTTGRQGAKLRAPQARRVTGRKLQLRRPILDGTTVRGGGPELRQGSGALRPVNKLGGGGREVRVKAAAQTAALKKWRTTVKWVHFSWKLSLFYIRSDRNKNLQLEKRHYFVGKAKPASQKNNCS